MDHFLKAYTSLIVVNSKTVVMLDLIADIYSRNNFFKYLYGTNLITYPSKYTYYTHTWAMGLFQIALLVLFIVSLDYKIMS